MAAVGHVEKRVRVEGESIWARRSSEKSGRFSSVEGTLRLMAVGRRAMAYALWGRMSRMRIVGSVSTEGSALGGRAVKAV